MKKHTLLFFVSFLSVMLSAQTRYYVKASDGNPIEKSILDSIKLLSPKYIRSHNGAPVTFELDVPVTSDHITYTWKYNDEVFSNEKNPTHTFTSSGAGYVTVNLKHSKSGREKSISSKLFLAKNSNYKVLGYSPWYRPYVNKQEMWSKLTHVCLTFGVVQSDGTVDVTSVVKNSLSQLVNDAHKNGVYVLLSLGGTSPETGSYGFTDAMLNQVTRKNLVNNLLSILNDYDLDGIDLDYEHWEYGKTTANNARTYALESLYKELRLVLPNNVLLTAAVNPTIVKNKYFTSSMLDELDFVGLMTYDKTGDWKSSVIGPHAHMDWVRDAMRFAKDSNLDKKKLLLGIPFYGKIFPNAPNPLGAINVPYKDIVAEYVGAENGCSIPDKNLYYDGIPLITEKSQFVIDNQMDGVIIWELSYDTEDPTKSLLTTIDAVFNNPN